MSKQLWDLSMRVDDEAKQPIDFKHRKWVSRWEFSITVKAGAANCRLNVCGVRVCMSVNIKKITSQRNRFAVDLEDRCHRCRRIAMLRSQDYMESLQSGCACGYVANPHSRAIIRSRTQIHRPGTQIDTGTHTDTETRQTTTNNDRFACLRSFGSCFFFSLSACRRILVVVRV